MVCPGSGLNAKLCELGGADLVTLVHTGLVRQMGLPSITKLDISPNEVVKLMMVDQFRATKQLPFLAGVDVSEFPADGDLNDLIDTFCDQGFSGLLNYPSSGEIGSAEFVAMAERGGSSDDEYQAMLHSGEMAMLEECRRKERDGVGYSRELELIRIAHDRDIFTAAYAFTPEQAADMARAGADCICGHCGGTGGGLVGHAETADHETASRRLNAIMGGARAVNPNILFFGHGGPFVTPEDTSVMYRYCKADGFIAGSAIDRIPIEKAVIGAAQAFKSAGK